MSVQIKIEDWIYIAGLFDGEGCINIVTDKARASYVSPSHKLRVQITNSHKETIMWLRNILTGGLCSSEPPSRKPHWKTHYIWYVSGRKALSFLKNVEPFLKIKKQQAQLGIEFQTSKKDNRLHWQGGSAALSLEELNKRESYKTLMHELNKKCRSL